MKVEAKVVTSVSIHIEMNNEELAAFRDDISAAGKVHLFDTGMLSLFQALPKLDDDMTDD